MEIIRYVSKYSLEAFKNGRTKIGDLIYDSDKYWRAYAPYEIKIIIPDSDK